MENEEWYADVAGRQVGPLSLEDLIELIRTAPRPAEVSVRCDEAAGWAPAGTVSRVSALLSSQAAYPIAGDVRSGGRIGSYWRTGGLLIAALIISVLLFLGAGGPLQSSDTAALDPGHKPVTRDGRTTYEVSYRFTVDGRTYHGRGTLDAAPAIPEVTVFYDPHHPETNALERGDASDSMLWASVILGMGSFFGSLFLLSGRSETAARRPRPGIGDSGSEHLWIRRGRYDGSAHVVIASLVEAAAISGFLTLSQRHPSDLSFVLGIASGPAFTLWAFADRWKCIEAYTSRFCTGCANISVLTAPPLALLYANYRAFLKLRGR